MPRFAAIEGLRAWLAWAVVISHIGQTVGMEMLGGHWIWLSRMGEAVYVFIAVSGFVIAGLVVDRREPWPRYIARRAFRIFPAYWVAYALALAVLPLAVASIPLMPMVNDPAFGWDELLRNWSRAMAERGQAQLALHATLLQGLVPDSVWPFTGTAVLGPAWSLTLEWQFYLVAPVLVWLLASARWRLLTSLVIVVVGIAFHEELLGTFYLPTFLPGAAYIFLIGIACRLGFAEMQRAPLGASVAIVALGVGLLFADALWLAIWAATYVFLLNGERWRTEKDVVGAAISGALESKPALYLGARSYSVYLVHLPVIELISWALLNRLHLTQMQLFFALLVLVPPVVLIVSEVLYRVVERPMIAAGARLAGRARAQPATA